MQGAPPSARSQPAPGAAQGAIAGLAARSYIEGFGAFRRAWGVLALVSAILVVVGVPPQLAQSASNAKLIAVQQKMEAAGTARGQELSGEAAVEALGAVGTSCCTGCGALLYSIFLMMPLVAGASIVGASAAAGRARFGQLANGFRRYGPTLVTGLVTLLVGGGAATVVALLGGFSIALSATKMASALIATSVLVAIAIVLVLVTLWLSVRLWYATLRVADLRRPRLGGMASVSWSWSATAGAVQWQLALVALGASTGFIVLLVAAGLANAYAGRIGVQSGSLVIIGVLALVSALLALPAFLAVVGASYEVVADRFEPIRAAADAGMALPPIIDTGAMS